MSYAATACYFCFKYYMVVFICLWYLIQTRQYPDTRAWLHQLAKQANLRSLAIDPLPTDTINVEYRGS